MLIKTIFAVIGMAAVGWLAWRLVSAQEPPDWDERGEKRATNKPHQHHDTEKRDDQTASSTQE